MEHELFEFSHGIVKPVINHDMIVFNVMLHLADCSLHAIVDLIAIIARTLGKTFFQRFNRRWQNKDADLFDCCLLYTSDAADE